MGSLLTKCFFPFLSFPLPLFGGEVICDGELENWPPKGITDKERKNFGEEDANLCDIRERLRAGEGGRC